LLFWQVTRSNVGWFGVARPTRKDIRWFLGLSGWFAAWKFVYELMTAGDVIVLGVFGSAQLVTTYTLTKFVSQALVPLIAVLFEGSSPGLGSILGGGDLGRSRRLRDELMGFSWIVCTALGAALLVWNRSFVGLWVGSSFYAGPTVMLLIVVMVTQFVFIGNDARIIDLTLKMRAKVLTGALSATLSVVFALVAMRVIGDDIVGVCVGIIAGRMILTVAYPVLIGRMIEDPLRRQLRAIPRPALTTAVLLATTTWLGQHVLTRSWVVLVVAGAATATLAAVVASVAGMSQHQRASLVARVERIVRGRRAEPAKSDGGPVS
jgi:hypothetical protein